MAREDFTFCHRVRVRWTETDLQGVVFFGHYLTYFDLGMTEYFRAIGFPYPDGLLEHGADFFVVKTQAEYRGSARFDEEIDICARPGRVGRSSLQMLFEIYREDELLVHGEIVYVNAEPESRRARPLPSTLREALTAMA